MKHSFVDYVVVANIFFLSLSLFNSMPSYGEFESPTSAHFLIILIHVTLMQIILPIH